MSSKNQPFGHWERWPRGFDPDNALGFVYLLVDTVTHEKYIGKKLLRGRGKRNLNVVSNWKTYTSSSKEVNRRIAEHGRERFRFIILEQYFTPGGLSFAETWSQVICEVPSRNEEFLNRFIDKVTWKVTEPVTEQHRKRLNYWRTRYSFPNN